MTQLELKFGCIDFIVHDGNWIFLEVNEMGNFLWKEVIDHKSRMLEFFVSVCEKLLGYTGHEEVDLTYKAYTDSNDEFSFQERSEAARPAKILGRSFE